MKELFPKDIKGIEVKLGDKVRGFGFIKFQDGFKIDRTPIVTANLQYGKLHFGNLSYESFTTGFEIVKEKNEFELFKDDFLSNFIFKQIPRPNFEDFIKVHYHAYNIVYKNINTINEYANIAIKKDISQFIEYEMQLNPKETFYIKGVSDLS